MYHSAPVTAKGSGERQGVCPKGLCLILEIERYWEYWEYWVMSYELWEHTSCVREASCYCYLPQGIHEAMQQFPSWAPSPEGHDNAEVSVQILMYSRLCHRSQRRCVGMCYPIWLPE